MLLKNASYNLMETASVVSKGLYRYRQHLDRKMPAREAKGAAA